GRDQAGAADAVGQLDLRLHRGVAPAVEDLEGRDRGDLHRAGAGKRASRQRPARAATVAGGAGRWRRTKPLTRTRAGPARYSTGDLPWTRASMRQRTRR